jgi:hypothetical protein
MSLPAHFFDEQGKLKSHRQRMAEQANIERAVKLVAIHAAAQAPKPVVSPYQARIDELKQRIEYAPSGERRALELRLNALVPAHQAWLDERNEEGRIARLQADPSAKLAIEHAGALERSYKASHPDCDEHAIRLAVELARSTAWNDPAEMTKAYWAAVSELDAKQHQAEDAKLSAALQASAKAQADAVKQELQTAKALGAAERSKLEAQQ